MIRLTNSIDYCAIYCDFGKRGQCFFKDKSKCYENNMFEKLKAYEEVIDDPEKLKLIDALYLERCEEINRLKEELIEYKKLEEEGVLLRLKAKIGDEVYEIHKLTGNITPRTITDILICNATDLTIFYRCNNYSIIDRAFGETVFFTKEEAEQALKRMKEVQDVN